MNPPIKDQFHRPLHDLRISVIDRCNFRCNYCMPKDNVETPYTFLKKENWLSFDNIERIARLFTQLGVRKIRLTGGEPLLRPNLPELIARLKTIEGISDLAMTTNGSLLAEQAKALKDAGLDRITISLDTLDPHLFKEITGQRGDVADVLAGIQKAEEADFPCIKINVVLQNNVNSHQILDLVRFFKGRKPILRFIEYMDVGNCNQWDRQAVVPASNVVHIINEHFPIKPIKPNYYGEVSSRYTFLDGEGEVGFISSVTQPFCRTCTRARLSTDGKVYTCLFASEGLDLRAQLAQNASDEELLNILRSLWQRRDDRYSELRSEILQSPQNPPTPKVEMFQIGG